MFLFIVCVCIRDTKHTVRKIRKYLELIAQLRVFEHVSVVNSSYCRNYNPKFSPPSDDDCEWIDHNFSSVFKFGKTKKEWLAFKGTLEIPEKYQITDYLVRFSFNIDKKYKVRPWDDDYPAGPEGRYWINGKPVAAIDEFHNGEVIDEPGSVRMQIFSGRCLSSHKVSRFGLNIVHKNTESLYHRIRFLLSLLKELPQDSPSYSSLLNILDETVSFIDVSDLSYPIPLHSIRKHDPTNAKFYNSTCFALGFLKNMINKLPKGLINETSISLIGYSHLDTCWEWPFSLSHYKFSNTVTTMLHLLEHPPFDFENPVNWKFLATSAQHYQWLEMDDNDLFKRVLHMAEKSRWDVNGAMWVEPDTNLPSGESLIRQIIIGKKYFEGLHGFKQTVLFLPDCFGFSASLPQILKLSGIDFFVTSKLSWSEYTEFPYSTFVWRGIDGSDIIAHFITTPCQWEGQASTYTGTATAKEIIGTYKNYKQKNLVKGAALHTAGNGDGGGGMTEEMLWNLNIIGELPHIESLPEIKYCSIDELFKEIKKEQNRLPIWDDELYLEYHRGTLTSQEEIKRQNKELEAALHNVEWLSSLLFIDNESLYDDLCKNIVKFWERMLVYQFHDSLPGTSINEATTDILFQGNNLFKEIRNYEKELANSVMRNIHTLTEDNLSIIFNTLSHPININGTIIPSCGWNSIQKDIPFDFVWTSYYSIVNDSDYEINEISYNSTVPDLYPSKSIFFINNTIVTPFLSIVFSKENGSILSIKSQDNEREFIKSPSNVFELYEDRPINWPAWDIQLYHKEMKIDMIKFINMSFDGSGITQIYEIPSNSTNNTNRTIITQRIKFSSVSPLIDFKTIINWTQHNKLLKVSFPTTIRARNAKYGIQFGYIERPTHYNTDRDMAKFEVFGRWSDLSDSSGGVSLMSDVKSGFDIHDGNIRLSLLKSPLQTDKWADFGTRKFIYRAIFHTSPFHESNIVHFSDDLVVHPSIVDYIHPKDPINEHSIPNNSSFVTLSNCKVIIETLTLSLMSKGVICRLYESTGGAQKTIVSFPLLDTNHYQIEIVDFNEICLEKYIEILPTSFLQVCLDLAPFEILSMKITRKVGINK